MNRVTVYSRVGLPEPEGLVTPSLRREPEYTNYQQIALYNLTRPITYTVNCVYITSLHIALPLTSHDSHHKIHLIHLIQHSLCPTLDLTSILFVI